MIQNPVAFAYELFSYKLHVATFEQMLDHVGVYKILNVTYLEVRLIDEYSSVTDQIFRVASRFKILF